MHSTDNTCIVHTVQWVWIGWIWICVVWLPAVLISWCNDFYRAYQRLLDTLITPHWDRSCIYLDVKWQKQLYNRVCDKQLHGLCQRKTAVEVCVCLALTHTSVTGNFSQNFCCIHPLAHEPTLTPCSWDVRETLTVSQLIKKLRILWNPKIYYRVHKTPPIVWILCQNSPIHDLKSCFNIHFNTILSSSHLNLELLSSPFPWSFPTQTLPTPFLSPACHIRSQSHS
jgi:hypothetical protein